MQHPEANFSEGNTDLSYIEKYPPTALRELFRQKVLANNAGWFLAEYLPPVTFPAIKNQGWCRYPGQPDFVYYYYRLLALSECIAWQILLNTQPTFTQCVNDQRPILCSLIEHDINRVIAPVAIAAWLTTDNFRWHQHINGIPKDLNYGLVLQYPEAIIAYAAFIAGFNRGKQLAILTPQIIAECENLATTTVAEQTKLPYTPTYRLIQQKITTVHCGQPYIYTPDFAEIRQNFNFWVDHFILINKETPEQARQQAIQRLKLAFPHLNPRLFADL